MAGLAGKRVLVTGGTGFLGSHLVARLEQSGAGVWTASRSKDGSGNCPGWRRADLTDIAMARELIAGIRPDLVFHLCSQGTGAPDMAHVLPVFHNDLLTTVNVLTVATEVGIGRLILAASMEEPHGPVETAVPSSPYAAAKWAGSAYARMYHFLYQTPVVMVRTYMTYGPGQAEHKLLPYVIASLLNGEAPKLSSGNRPVDWIYVDDVINGMLAAAQKPGIEGNTIDLGSGTLVPIKVVVEKLARIVNNGVQPLFGALPDRRKEMIRPADTQSAYALLGWKPVTGLEDGLRQTVAWHRSRGCSKQKRI